MAYTQTDRTNIEVLLMMLAGLFIVSFPGSCGGRKPGNETRTVINNKTTGEDNESSCSLLLQAIDVFCLCVQRNVKTTAVERHAPQGIWLLQFILQFVFQGHSASAV